jgi:hypothetical protein
MIRFEPKMDVPDIWKAKKCIMVMIIHYIVHCMIFPQMKRVFSHHRRTYSQLWRCGVRFFPRIIRVEPHQEMMTRADDIILGLLTAYWFLTLVDCPFTSQ